MTLWIRCCVRLRRTCPEQNGKVERSYRTDGEEFYRLQKNWDFDHLVKERKKLVVSEANLYDDPPKADTGPTWASRGLRPLKNYSLFLNSIVLPMSIANTKGGGELPYWAENSVHQDGFTQTRG